MVCECHERGIVGASISPYLCSVKLTQRIMKVKGLFLFLSAIALTSCNSNDDGVSAGIEIPGITITNDIDCCTAEQALQAYKFLETVKIIPTLTTEVDRKYNVYAYTRTGKFHIGYNEVFFVATKKSSNNYIKDFSITGLTPLMLMTKMKMEHSTPVSGSAEVFNDNFPAIKRAWVSFIMSSGESGSWTLSYHVDVLGGKGDVNKAGITVDALPDGQAWLKSFKVGDDTYFLSLANASDWKTGSNVIRAYISKKSTPITTPYALAEESFTVDIDPRMPDMGNHTSPDNRPLPPQATINLTMTGLWRIHLTIRDAQGHVVAGGDNQSSGYSSLFWDVTI